MVLQFTDEDISAGQGTPEVRVTCLMRAIYILIFVQGRSLTHGILHMYIFWGNYVDFDFISLEYSSLYSTREFDLGYLGSVTAGLESHQ